MPKVITRYVHVAEDGTEHASHEAALAHEVDCLLSKNDYGAYLQRYEIEAVVKHLIAHYTLEPKPAAVLLTEDPDHA
jgi:hypothetical protein